MLIIKVLVKWNDKKIVLNNKIYTPAKWPKVKLFQWEEKEAKAAEAAIALCVYNTTALDTKLGTPTILVLNCKLTRFLNKKFPVHLKWKKCSCAISTSPKKLPANETCWWEDWRQNVYGQVMAPSLALTWSFSLKKAYFEIWKNHLLNSFAVYCETYFEGYK